MFKICLSENHYEADENSSLAFGWFELNKSELTVYFFRDRKCMVFLTLYTLIESLLKLKIKNETQRWVGEDNGKVFFLNKQKTMLTIEDKDVKLTTDFSVFLDAVVAEAKSLLRDSKTRNPDIIEEGPYIDLESLVSDFDN